MNLIKLRSIQELIESHNKKIKQLYIINLEDKQYSERIARIIIDELESEGGEYYTELPSSQFLSRHAEILTYTPYADELMEYGELLASAHDGTTRLYSFLGLDFVLLCDNTVIPHAEDLNSGEPIFSGTISRRIGGSGTIATYEEN